MRGPSPEAMGGAMIERGIIFGAPMIRAIIAGKKSQTRRVVSRTNCIIDGDKRATAEHWNQIGIRTAWTAEGPSPAGNAGPYLKAECDCWGVEEGIVHRLYPQWHVGQKLWVRESFSLREYGPHCIESLEPAVWFWADGNPDAHNWTRPKSPIYMPRQASRLTLEIVRVGVERVREISEEDARAEGVPCDSAAAWSDTLDYESAVRNGHRAAFRDLWNTIHGKRPGCSWDDGPFVWVLEFKITGGSND